MSEIVCFQHQFELFFISECWRFLKMFSNNRAEVSSTSEAELRGNDCFPAAFLNVTPGWLIIRRAGRADPDSFSRHCSCFGHTSATGSRYRTLREPLITFSSSRSRSLALLNKSFRYTQTISRRQNRGQASVMSWLILLLSSLKPRGRRNGTQNQHAHNGALLEPP